MLITPNRLTYLRIFFCFFAVILVFNEMVICRWISLALIVLAGLTDRWDGQLARKYGMETTVGKILDPIADKFLIIGMMCSYSYLDVYSFWFVVPIILREVIITIIRFVLLSKKIVVAAEKSGKIKMVFQLSSIYVSFLYLMERDYTSQVYLLWQSWYSPFFNILQYTLLITAVILTVYSGVEFFKNNWSKIRA